MAYMNKYPSSFDTRERPVSDETTSAETIAAELERTRTAQEPFSWPPPSAVSVLRPLRR